MEISSNINYYCNQIAQSNAVRLTTTLASCALAIAASPALIPISLLYFADPTLERIESWKQKISNQNQATLLQQLIHRINTTAYCIFRKITSLSIQVSILPFIGTIKRFEDITTQVTQTIFDKLDIPIPLNITTRQLTSIVEEWEKNAVSNQEDRARAKQLILDCYEKASSTLTLSNCQLHDLPDIFHHKPFTNLRCLVLENNQLTELPERICNLKQLSYLYINNNQLTDLPESFSNLQQLYHLYIDNNQLTQIPKSIFYLKQLRTLTLHDNQLTEIPIKFSQFLNNLKTLNLGRNPITNIMENRYLRSIGVFTDPMDDKFSFDSLHDLSTLKNQLAISDY